MEVLSQLSEEETNQTEKKFLLIGTIPHFLILKIMFFILKTHKILMRIMNAISLPMI